MTAADLPRAVDEAGKSTSGGGRPSAGDATRALALPHLPYGDAVVAELAAARVQAPEVVEAGLRTGLGVHAALFLRLVWPPKHPGLSEAVRAEGMSLAWSHVTGWSAHTARDSRVLDVDTLADPVLVADAAAHFTRHGLGRPYLAPFAARWQYALELDIALVHFDERPTR